MWLLHWSITTICFTLHSAPNSLISDDRIGIVENPLYVDEEMVDTSSYSAADSKPQDYDEKPLNAVSFDFGQAKPE